MNQAVRRIYLTVVLIAVLIALSTAGYMLVSGMSFIDALYMTIITITTVGYEEVKPLDTAGRIYTMSVILIGVGAAFYLFGGITEMVVGGQLRELVGRTSMDRKIHHLENHVILCGYGRFGAIVAEELRSNGISHVIVESDPRKESELVRANELYILGSALDEEILQQAGIATAADIVIATASDPDNVYISLSARSANPRIRIHARAESEIGLKHLRLAGVERAISSYQWSALRIANSIARPSVVDFLGLILPGRGDEEISIEEVVLPAQSQLSGKTIAQVEQIYDRVRIVASKRGDEPICLIPAPNATLVSGDALIVIGARNSLSKLATSLV
jgi:voltage-gated potassium channel